MSGKPEKEDNILVLGCAIPVVDEKDKTLTFKKQGIKELPSIVHSKEQDFIVIPVEGGKKKTNKTKEKADNTREA